MPGRYIAQEGEECLELGMAMVRLLGSVRRV
jgi:hypothetical protein